MAQNKLLWLIILASAVILPRVFDLDTFQTADEKRWLANVSGFTTSLSQFKWDNLLQQPHPGITTQWLAAAAVWSDSWAIRKLPLVTSQIILLFFAGYLAKKLWGAKTAGILILLLALNPLLIAHTRIYAMDSLLAIWLLISALSLLLWNKTGTPRYLVYSGAAGALAALSKLPGIIMLPLAVGVFAYASIQKKKIEAKPLIIWIISFFITLPVVLPSLATNTISVLQEFAGFFSSGDYTELHQESNFYYVRTLIFFSTPLHLLAAVALPWLYYVSSKRRRFELTVIAALAILFAITMSLGAKKGDRYILPVFLLLDTVAALTITRFAKLASLQQKAWLTAIPVILILWQAVTIWQLHPYTLSYVNPLTKPWFGDQRLGWGEGLDIAADYLNKKAEAKDLTVAVYYPNEFANYFTGRAVPLHQWDNGTADYAVLYRAQFQRGEDAWETDVLNQFKGKPPEYTVTLNGLGYTWIYRLADSAD